MITTNDFERINNDTNGNPRYVLHFLNLEIEKDYTKSLTERYNEALFLAKKAGGKKFHNKQYGGGVAFTSYNLRDLAEKLNNLIGAK
jgi:hypothetical protein